MCLCKAILLLSINLTVLVRVLDYSFHESFVFSIFLGSVRPSELIPRFHIHMLPVSYTHLDVYKRQPSFISKVAVISPSIRTVAVDTAKLIFNFCVYPCGLY